LKSALSNQKDIVKRIEKAVHLLLFLDYDGTLSPIVSRPEDALLPKSSKILLESIAKKNDVTVSVVTGRSLKEIKRLIGIKGIYYAGCHGFEVSQKRRDHTLPEVKKVLPLIKKIKSTFKKELKDIKGAQIEDKGPILALHYRRVKKSQIHDLKEIFDACLSPYLKSKKITTAKGKMVLEVRPSMDWNKGRYCLYLIENLKKKYNQILPIYIGDDETDETAFKVLKRKGITVFVKGEKKTSSAEYYLKSTEEVLKLLISLF